MNKHLKQSAFGFEKPEQSLGFMLWQATVVWQQQIKKVLDIYDISHSQFVLLAMLLYAQECDEKPTQVMLSSRSKLDKMTVSNSLSVLSDRGFVERTEDVRDTRAKIVGLTAKGVELVRVLVKSVEEVDAQFFSLLKKDEERALLEGLHKVI